MKFSFTVKELQHGMRLNIFLRENGVSAALIRKIKFTPDGMLVNGEKKNADWLLNAGDVVEINTADDTMESTVIPQQGKLDIVYMDDCCMVANKPSDMPCHLMFKSGIFIMGQHNQESGSCKIQHLLSPYPCRSSHHRMGTRSRIS